MRTGIVYTSKTVSLHASHISIERCLLNGTLVCCLHKFAVDEKPGVEANLPVEGARFDLARVESGHICEAVVVREDNLWSQTDPKDSKLYSRYCVAA